MKLFPKRIPQKEHTPHLDMFNVLHGLSISAEPTSAAYS
jgi:hypothetical protein